MKKHLLHLFILFLLVCSGALQAQVVLDSFDSSVKDTMYQTNVEGKSRMTIKDDTAVKHDGAASLNVYAVIDSVHPWGSYAQLIHTEKTGQYLDISSSDSISLWIKVNKAPALPENMVFRIHFADQPTATSDKEEYIFEHPTVLDKANGWVKLSVPLFERNQPGADIPDSTGFILAPTSWGGFKYNNKKLDRDKIVGINIAIITTGWTDPRNLPMDSIDVNFDHFVRFGHRSVPFVIFNGKVIGSAFTNYGGWSGSSVGVEANAGSAPKKSAMVWTMAGTGGADQWSGLFFDMTPTNMAGNFVKGDSLKFKIKAAAGTPKIRIQFIGGNGAIKWVLDEAVYKWDNTWKTVALPVGSYLVSDNKPNFDSTNVTKFEILTENAHAINTKIYFDDMWIGSPVFDVVAPEAPTNLKATAGQYSNLITWKDTPGEPGGKYDVYYSPKPITDLTAKEIEVVKLGVVENEMQTTHTLRAPNTDQDVTYYYAVTCTDGAGNVSPVAASGAVTTKAKGVPTISLVVPSNFKVDGNVSEWTSAGVKPIGIKLSDGTGTLNENGKIDNDADLSVLAYLSVDKDNLYVAFDVTDDVVNAGEAAAANRYERDCPDLFLGLYNFHGTYHKSYARGATPDYHFRFNNDKVYFDGQNSDSLVLAGPNYVFKEKLQNGYTIEAKIPLADIATKRNSGFTGTLDQLFVPAEGMRIPIDFSVNDNDDGAKRSGILCYSPANNDQSWGDVSRWTYTWIGNKMYTGVENITNGPVKNYALSQNFPNPFNPTTTIRYSVAKPGMVTLKVYDVVGREVANLVSQEQAAGQYQIQFDASSLSSGLYFYRIQSGEFTATNKMMLIK